VTIDGGPGNDHIDTTGLQSKAKLIGGAGHDTLIGGSNNDDIQGDYGDDILRGGPGDDTIDGGSGNDTIDGGSGNDTIDGEFGNDKLYGGLGDDHIEGGSDAGNDRLFGGDGNDHILAGDGNDYVVGGLGFDRIESGSGIDDVVEDQDKDDYNIGGNVRWHDQMNTDVGNAFQVNLPNSNEQSLPAIATAADGSFIVTWTSWYTDGSESGIYAQRYTSSGQQNGGAFLVNSTTQGRQERPAIAISPSGSFFVISSESFGQDGSDYGVFAQYFTINFINYKL